MAHRAAHDAYTAVLSGLSEAAFQAIVVSHLRSRGWTVWTVPNMRATTAGLPDVLACHPERAVLVAWELKAVKTRVTPAQVQSLAILARIPGVHARIVRPGDWPPLRDALDRGEL